MSVVARYRQYAGSCLRAAQLVSDRVIRTALIDMAQAWNAMAERTEDNPPPPQAAPPQQPQTE